MTSVMKLANLPAIAMLLVSGSLFLLVGLMAYLFRRPSLPLNAPRLARDTVPILGSMAFFTQRYDFCRRAAAHSSTGSFSFFAGAYPVVGLSGEAQRKIFFEHRDLALAEGYGALLGGSPTVTENNSMLAETRERDSEFNGYLVRRLTTLLKGSQLKHNLPGLLRDVRAHLDAVAADPRGRTDPFDSIYRAIFQITMRTLACREIADDPPLLAKVLALFETIEETATPLAIMYPWMPLPAKAKRMYAGMQLYMIFKRVVDDRIAQGRREDDALQYLMDQNDDITAIITFVLGALFAGQVNSGVFVPYVLCYLSQNPSWMQRARAEVGSVADRHCSDPSLPLRERLMHVPLEAWDTEFPVLDLCLKDTIRLQLTGVAIRQNRSGQDIPLGKHGKDKSKEEVIPADAYVVLPAGDMHYDPDIYPDPDVWDPARYLPNRAEDKKQSHAWMGWGLARHPCLGMRFAKLENNVIIAFFLAYFDDFQLVDAQGREHDRPPPVQRNNLTPRKPADGLHLKFRAPTT